MKNQSSKVKCIKKSIRKCSEVCRCYNDIQAAYVDVLQCNSDIVEVKCNVLLVDFSVEGRYTTDFLCTKVNGDLMVRECVWRKLITKPLTVRLLDTSREYWLRRGVSDWGIVVDAE